MGAARSSHMNRVRTHVHQIFGPQFEQKWFATKYDRGSVDILQGLSGAYITPQGKKYRLLPPILFPDGSQSKKDVFLNPALVRVSFSFYRIFAT